MTKQCDIAVLGSATIQYSGISAVVMERPDNLDNPPKATAEVFGKTKNRFKTSTSQSF